MSDSDRMFHNIQSIVCYGVVHILRNQPRGRGFSNAYG